MHTPVQLHLRSHAHAHAHSSIHATLFLRSEDSVLLSCAAFLSKRAHTPTPQPTRTRTLLDTGDPPHSYERQCAAISYSFPFFERTHLLTSEAMMFHEETKKYDPSGSEYVCPIGGTRVCFTSHARRLKDIFSFNGSGCVSAVMLCWSARWTTWIGTQKQHVHTHAHMHMAQRSRMHEHTHIQIQKFNGRHTCTCTHIRTRRPAYTHANALTSFMPSSVNEISFHGYVQGTQSCTHIERGNQYAKYTRTHT